MPRASPRALIAYRLIYYLLPLLRRGAAVRRAPGASRQRAPSPAGSTSPAAAQQLVLPNLLATLVFIGGAILLISGATPTVPERLAVAGPGRPAGADRALALPRQPCRAGAPRPGARPAPAPRRRLVDGVRRDRRRDRPVSWSRASTGRRRSIWRSSSPRCCRRAGHSTARAGCSSSASRPRGWCAIFAVVRRHDRGSASSATGMSSTPTSCGGSSCSRATPPAFCAPRPG